MPEKPTETLTAAQIGVVIGLDTILQMAGLILTCPRCASEGNPRLITDNGAEDTIWKIDCQCRKRRIQRRHVSQLMAPSGDLLLLVSELLKPVGLDVRCPTTRCLLSPLEMRRTEDSLIVSCHCGRMVFHKTEQSLH